MKKINDLIKIAKKSKNRNELKKIIKTCNLFILHILAKRTDLNKEIYELILNYSHNNLVILFELKHNKKVSKNLKKRIDFLEKLALS